MAVRIKVKDNNNFAKLIYTNGYTVRSLARESGVSDTTIQLMVDGSREGCSANTVKKILNVLGPLGIKFDDIFFIVFDCKSKKTAVDEQAATLEPTGTDGR